MSKLKRELKYFSWEYENGKVTLFDKVNGTEFVMPMSMVDSFMRAAITFKNSFRNEKLKGLQKRIMMLRKDNKQIREEEFRTRMAQRTLPGIVTKRQSKTSN